MIQIWTKILADKTYLDNIWGLDVVDCPSSNFALWIDVDPDWLIYKGWVHHLNYIWAWGHTVDHERPIFPVTQSNSCIQQILWTWFMKSCVKYLFTPAYVEGLVAPYQLAATGAFDIQPV